MGYGPQRTRLGGLRKRGGRLLQNRLLVERHRRSLGYARDDKGESSSYLKIGYWLKALATPLAFSRDNKD